MEGAPVVEIVQVHSAGIDGAVVWKSIGFENGVSRRVCVDVSEDGRVVFIDGCLVELHSRLLLDPSFELRVGGFGLNKRTHGGSLLSGGPPAPCSRTLCQCRDNPGAAYPEPRGKLFARAVAV